ncbi:MAG: hypothetical protein JKY25_05055 [Robiginitomaculum sp.]|nr:hypothetical protein [Robiginitomaculum sp.]
MNQSVREIVGLVHASGSLGKSKRQSDLLRYLLTAKEQGRLDSISQYSIAIDVLGRPESFDSSTDSIVRGEMHRLRKNLKLFNGQSKGLHLKIPRAEFEVVVKIKTENQKFPFLKIYYKPLAFAATALVVATFGLVTMPANTPTSAFASNCSSMIPNVSVVNSGSSTDLQLYVGKIIRSSLSQYTNIQLVDDIEACADNGTPSFTVDYMVFEENGTYRVALTTYNELPANIVGFTNIGGVIGQPDDKDDLYYTLATLLSELAKPYGTIARHSVTKTWNSQTYKNNYRCLIVMYDSFSGESSREYEEAFSCLKNSAESNLASLDNLGGLAASYLEQAQGYRSKTTDNPLLEAHRIIEGAGDRWITSAEMTTAKIVYEAERPDFSAERLKRTLNDAEIRYKSHPQTLLIVAAYTGYKLGDWEHAKHLSNQVKRIHSERDNSVFVIEAAYSILYESPKTSMEACKNIYSKNSLIANLIVHACARQAQDKVWFEKTQSNLNRLQYSTTARQIKFLKNKNLDSAFTDKIIGALSLPPV